MCLSSFLPLKWQKKKGKNDKFGFCLFVCFKQISLSTQHEGRQNGYHVNRQKFWIVSEILKVSIENRVLNHYRRKIYTVKLKVISINIQEQNKETQEIGEALEGNQSNEWKNFSQSSWAKNFHIYKFYSIGMLSFQRCL